MNNNITCKELYVITAAVNTWGHLWKWKKVLFHCDHQSVCAIWQAARDHGLSMYVVTVFLFCPFCHTHDDHTHRRHQQCYCRCSFLLTVQTLQAIGPEYSRSTRYHSCMAHSVLDQLLIQYQSLGVAAIVIAVACRGPQTYYTDITCMPEGSLTNHGHTHTAKPHKVLYYGYN